MRARRPEPTHRKNKIMPLRMGGRKENGRPPPHPDLEELLKRSQDKLKQVMSGGTGLPGSLLFLITVAITAIIAFFAFTFRVDPDELGVVMLFGKPVRTEPPGLHFRLPYPIEERDVQAARADKERLQNEAGTYANKIVPEARGDAERILQAARAYKEQTVAEATGQSARFLKVYEEYKKAPEVTRKRMYLETMERVLGGTDKIILD